MGRPYSFERDEKAEALSALVAGGLAVAMFLALSVVVATAAVAPGGGKGRPEAVRRYAKLPLAFEKNQGQFGPQVRFAARGGGFAGRGRREAASACRG